MSTQQFVEFMRGKSPDSEFTWETHMLPKIKDLVWRSLKCIQDTQEQRANCFEVFGFDIMVD